MLNAAHVEWVGEISDQEKDEFLGNAYALLFPIDWPEPFGLVMIEAMACGTPVIAYNHGAVPEVMEDGQTGFIAKNLEDTVEAIRRVPDLNRAVCRNVFEKRFTVSRMASDYVNVYTNMIDRRMKNLRRRVEFSFPALKPSHTTTKRKQAAKSSTLID
jgi:glycosyltransferase involved in cell wall biosynthesis